MAATDLQVSLEVLLLVSVGRCQAEDVVVPGPRGLDVQLLLLDRQVPRFLLQRLARREQRNDVLLTALRPEINPSIAYLTTNYGFRRKRFVNILK